MILYSAKSTIDVEGYSATRITKFADGNVESSYLTTPGSCDCPAGVRPTCRHRQMLPAMIDADIINTHWFWDFDRRLVVDFDGSPRPPLCQPEPDLPLPAGEALQRDLPLEYTCPKCGAQADERFDCCEVHAITPVTSTFVDLPGGLEKRKGLPYPITSTSATWRRF